MPANIAEKEAVVKDILDKIESSKSIVFIDYRGLTVAEVTELRNRYRAAGVDYKVLKNTMIFRAIDGKPEYEDLKEFLAGPTAVAFATEDAVAGPKITYDYIKQIGKMEVKTGLMDGKVVTADELKVIASLPSKEVLIAKALGSLKAPISNFVYVLNAIKEDKEKNEGAAPVAAAEETPVVEAAPETPVEEAAPVAEAPAEEVKEEKPADAE